MEKRKVMHLYYHENENFFTDGEGCIIYNPFTIITPQDLFMFRHDPGFNLFPMVGSPDILCEIIPIPDEICGLQELDLGDDYERIKRYANSRKVYG